MLSAYLPCNLHDFYWPSRKASSRPIFSIVVVFMNHLKCYAKNKMLLVHISPCVLRMGMPACQCALSRVSSSLLAPGNNYRIVLNFTFMETECTYDYLFVYDGDSYQSPLLASLSGNTRPQPIEAKSGQVRSSMPPHTPSFESVQVVLWC